MKRIISCLLAILMLSHSTIIKADSGKDHITIKGADISASVSDSKTGDFYFVNDKPNATAQSHNITIRTDKTFAKLSSAENPALWIDNIIYLTTESGTTVWRIYTPPVQTPLAALDKTDTISIDHTLTIIAPDYAKQQQNFIITAVQLVSRGEYLDRAVQLYESEKGTVQYFASPFEDIAGSKYKTSIDKAYSIGLVRGVAQNVFNPNATITDVQKESVLENLKKAKRYDPNKLTIMLPKQSELDTKDIVYLYDERTAEFMNAYPSINIDLNVTSPDTYYETLCLLLAANDSPDIYTTNSNYFQRFNDRAPYNYSADLNDVLSKTVLADIDPNYLNLATFNGRLTYMPLYANPIVLFYDKSAVGKKAPESWGDILTLNQTQTVWPEKLSLASYGNIMATFGMNPITQAGDKMYTSDFFLTDEYNHMLKYFANINQNEKAGGSEGTALLSLQRLSAFKLDERFKNSESYGIAPFPVGSASASDVYIAGYAVSAGCINKQLANVFLEFMWQDKFFIDEFHTRGMLPTKISIQSKEPFKAEELQAIMSCSAGFYVKDYSSYGYSAMAEIIEESLSRVKNGENPEAITLWAQQRAREMLALYSR